MWILFVFGAVVIMSFSGLLDSFLSNNRFKSGTALALFSAVLNIIFIPVVWYIDPPGVPPLSLVPIFLLASFFDIAYLIPYYRAVKLADASVVAALFQFSRLFVPLFAFFVVGERMGMQDYVGFALIMVSGMALSFKSGMHFRFDKAFWLMIFASIMISANVALYKYQLERVSWGTSMIWGSLFTVPWLILLGLGAPKLRRVMTDDFQVFKSSWILILVNETINFSAIALSMYGLFLAPASKASALWGVQPFVILALAWFIHRLGFRGVLEDVSRGSIFKKTLLFCVMAIGVFLIKGE